MTFASKRDGPRTVFVTGAASGLGLELSKQFLAKGDRVILSDLDNETPASVRALSGDWSYRTLDVTNDADWQLAAEEINQLYRDMPAVLPLGAFRFSCRR